MISSSIIRLISQRALKTSCLLILGLMLCFVSSCKDNPVNNKEEEEPQSTNPPSIPTNLSPESGATVSTNITLTWDEVTDASQYEVQLATDSNFENIISNTSADNPSYQYEEYELYKQYYWKVRAKNSAGAGEWSATRTLSINNIIYDPRCVNGMAHKEYDCKNVDLVQFLTVDDLMGERVNDIWGWTDPMTDKEYALVGLSDGVTFVDMSKPDNARILGKLTESETQRVSAGTTNGHLKSLKHDDEGKSTWRDLKVYNNHLYVVSDAQPHGLQVFDLTKLRNVESPPVQFTEDYLYQGFSPAHNIAINKESGYAYAVGSDVDGGGLHILDLSQPLNPTFVGAHADSTVGRNLTGYVHDTQCVNYKGPDPDYQGEEICFNSSETHFVIANVSDKSATATISKATYDDSEYIHQGWLTEDHSYFLQDDELDEKSGKKTTTYVWDVRDLDNPKLINEHTAASNAIDHNLYIKNGYAYQANYTSGLRILDLSNIASGTLNEVAYFDTFPQHNETEFDGAWSSYPFFESGLIIVSDISNGLFILRPNI
ncbi:choice-of-anchor B family protein [Fodinibius halophilus]|uniref:Choice-of-anchor B family protein n=1 Tax=Fodinibius halophilus TaxID=1736908 RepID=A0A6M1T6F9_9BACT|nr:choice-of-anchor B family protein [Fodinibius halophilus]NGP89669.1 choice-of-anchor B family protein [Fodinibius halophilus]